MKSWTVEEMLAEKPCDRYDEARIRKLWGEHETRSLADLLTDERIPPADRMWPVWRPGALTRVQARAVLDRIVTRAVTNHALNCGLPDVETWARGWLDGSDRSWVAAWAAARAARAARAAGAAEHRLQIADILAALKEKP